MHCSQPFGRRAQHLVRQQGQEADRLLVAVIMLLPWPCWRHQGRTRRRQRAAVARGHRQPGGRKRAQTAPHSAQVLAAFSCVRHDSPRSRIKSADSPIFLRRVRECGLARGPRTDQTKPTAPPLRGAPHGIFQQLVHTHTSVSWGASRSDPTRSPITVKIFPNTDPDPTRHTRPLTHLSPRRRATRSHAAVQ